MQFEHAAMQKNATQTKLQRKNLQCKKKVQRHRNHKTVAQRSSNINHHPTPTCIKPPHPSPQQAQETKTTQQKLQCQKTATQKKTTMQKSATQETAMQKSCNAKKPATRQESQSRRSAVLKHQPPPDSNLHQTTPTLPPGSPSNQDNAKQMQCKKTVSWASAAGRHTPPLNQKNCSAKTNAMQKKLLKCHHGPVVRWSANSTPHPTLSHPKPSQSTSLPLTNLWYFDYLAFAVPAKNLMEMQNIKTLETLHYEYEV